MISHLYLLTALAFIGYGFPVLQAPQSVQALSAHVPARHQDNWHDLWRRDDDDEMRWATDTHAETATLNVLADEKSAPGALQRAKAQIGAFQDSLRPGQQGAMRSLSHQHDPEQHGWPLGTWHITGQVTKEGSDKTAALHIPWDRTTGKQAESLSKSALGDNDNIDKSAVPGNGPTISQWEQSTQLKLDEKAKEKAKKERDDATNKFAAVYRNPEKEYAMCQLGKRGLRNRRSCNRPGKASTHKMSSKNPSAKPSGNTKSRVASVGQAPKKNANSHGKSTKNIGSKQQRNKQKPGRTKTSPNKANTPAKNRNNPKNRINKTSNKTNGRNNGKTRGKTNGKTHGKTNGKTNGKTSLKQNTKINNKSNNQINSKINPKTSFRAKSTASTKTNKSKGNTPSALTKPKPNAKQSTSTKPKTLPKSNAKAKSNTSQFKPQPKVPTKPPSSRPAQKGKKP